MKVFILFAFILLSSCTPKSQSPCGFITNPWGERIALKESQLKFYIDESVPQEYDQLILESIQTWNELFESPIFIVEFKRISKSIQAKDEKNIIYFINNWDKEKRGVQALASIYWMKNKIHEADILINIEEFRFMKKDVRSQAQMVDFKSLLIHELGHTLGLSHNESSHSAMYSYLASMQKRPLSKMDRENVSCEYNMKKERMALNQ